MHNWAALLLTSSAMGVFGMFRRRNPVPGWAAYFTRDDFEAFLECVKKYWKDRGIRVRVEDQSLFVDADGWPEQMGLSNLAQQCHQCPPPRWTEVVGGHFDTLARARDEQREWSEKLNDYESIRELLGVRIAAYDLAPDLLVHRTDLAGTRTYLCLDFPSSVMTVTPENTAQWGIGSDELFAVALENVRRTCVPELSREEFEPGVPFYALTGPSFFVATHALMLRRWAGFEGKRGSLVAIPHRHALLCHPINDMQSVKAVHRLGIMAYNMEQQGPGSITPNLYWYRDGGFLQLPYEIADKTFNFRPPNEFIDMLNQLAASEK